MSMKEYPHLLHFLEHSNTDPSRLTVEDELSGIYNRRFLRRYLQDKVQWDSLESEPVSLLKMDLDHFKHINDTHGHDVGDQTLIWVAELMKEVSREKGLAVRYDGDEFVILMPGANKEKALQVGQELIQLAHERPALDNKDIELPITFSIGVASAPEDAQTGNDLMSKADTALFYAKTSGRARLVNAGQVPLQDVFPQTTLQKLDRVHGTGRETQYARLNEALTEFSQGANQFLLIEGVDGMGKSEFLKSIPQKLDENNTAQIKVNGIPQENFRPYYLITLILAEIMKQRPDKGRTILDDLTGKELTHLSCILPQLVRPRAQLEPEDGRTQREELFSTLVQTLPKLLDSRPLILLIDDLQFSDEASLLLLRRLLLSQNIPVFICGTSTHIQPGEIEGAPTPLESFFAAHYQELNIVRVLLTPLTATHIAQHFQKIFPQLRLPENFAEHVALLTQGNPLFINELMRKLVLGRKIAFTGQLWDIEPLEKEDLPRSLKEMIRQKLAVLNEENRKLLDQASTFGEQVSLSMLGGSSETKEGKILDFIDEGVALGLIGSQYQVNDETLRFLSRSILDITYGAIEKNRKRELHERIGNYQETRHAQGLLLSATTLAYHFQRSSNQAKAQLYRESQQAYDETIFNAEEAIRYNGESSANFGPLDIPLEPAALVHIPEVIRTLLTTTRKIQLYPPGSRAIVSATGQMKESIDKILVHNDRLNITQAKKALSVNGEPLDVTEYNSIAETFVNFMVRLGLQGIAFSRGLTEQELRGMLESLDQVSTKVIDRHFWERFVSEQDFTHIELEQVRYTPMAAADELQEAARFRPKPDAASLLAADQGLDEQDLNQVPRVVRCLLTASNNIKLYPPQSQVIRRSIEDLRVALQTILDRRPALTLARVQEALLVNGQKVETQDFKAIADGFLNLLETIGLRSLSFLQHISSQELTTFITALRQPPTEKFDRRVWRRLAQDQGLSGILFDQRTYEILERQAGVGTAQEGPWEEAGTRKEVEPGQIARVTDSHLPAQGAVEPQPVQPTEAFPHSMETRLKDLFLQGDREQARQMIRQFFQEFDHQTPQIRTEAIQVCGRLLKELDSQPRLAELLTNPLLLAFAKEENTQLLGVMAALLFRTGIHLILLADYTQATRILTHLGQRQRKQREKQDQEAGSQEGVFLQGLDPKTRRLLLEDLKSQEPTRVEETRQLLSCLGPVALPLLMEVIKEEDNVELRQIASRLLGRLGQEAATVLKRELVLEGIAEQRVRILEAIGEITRDLKTELGYALEEESPKVRQAAFHLLESFHDERLISRLFDYVKHPDSTVAVAAVRSLGRIKPAGAVDMLVSLIDSAWEKERVMAACQALGKIADPAAIEPLARLIAPRGLFSRHRSKSPFVRAASASALAQISHPKVAKVLARHLEDRDSRVRQIAREIVNRP